MEAGQKILLYEWTQQVRLLYPHKQIHNPYESLLLEIGVRVKAVEKELLKETVKCFTLLNQYSRSQSAHVLESSREDLLNGLQLFLSVVCDFSPSSMRLYMSLCETFGTREFTYQDFCLAYKSGYSTAKRKLSPLLSLGFLSKTRAEQFGKSKMRIAADIFPEITPEPEELSIYEEAFSEWEDFESFNDLTYRT